MAGGKPIGDGRVKGDSAGAKALLARADALQPHQKQMHSSQVTDQFLKQRLVPGHKASVPASTDRASAEAAPIDRTKAMAMVRASKCYKRAVQGLRANPPAGKKAVITLEVNSGKAPRARVVTRAEPGEVRRTSGTTITCVLVLHKTTKQLFPLTLFMNPVVSGAGDELEFK